MSPVEICGHATYVLLALSYIVRDVVWLRAISIPASVCSILFNYFAPAEPIWLIINWNLVFLSVNIFQIVATSLEGRQNRLSGDLAEFASMVSPRLSVSQSTQLFKLAERKDVVGPFDLLLEGERASELILVMRGRVEITKDQNAIGSCEAGTFLGEISFLTSEPHTASAIVPRGESATVLCWDQRLLKRFAKSRPQFHVALQSCLAENLSRKFMAREIPTAACEPARRPAPVESA